MIDINDFILIGGKTKRYKLYCDTCGIDRGYGMKVRSSMSCKKCAHKGKSYTDHTTQEYRAKMSLAKKGQIPHNKNKGRSKTHKQIRNNFSAAIRKRLKSRNGSKKGQSYLSKVGYSIEELQQHLESRFLSGMTWNNYGFRGWHIDHIKPDSLFCYNNMDDEGFKASWALENLQPLWWQDNLIKGNKVQ